MSEVWRRMKRVLLWIAMLRPVAPEKLEDGQEVYLGVGVGSAWFSKLPARPQVPLVSQGPWKLRYTSNLC
jgi:hypothetical protein